MQPTDRISPAPKSSSQKLMSKKQFASILHSMDAELSLIESRLEKTRDLKQGMMQEAFDRPHPFGLIA